MNDKILWLDLETTGLNPRHTSILEIACVLTDGAFKRLDSYQAVLNFSDTHNRSIDKVVLEMHEKNGLWRECETGRELQDVEFDLTCFMQKNGLRPVKPLPSKERPMLAGNSVHFDKGFIEYHLPYFSNLLSHRVLDVTSMRQALRVFKGIDPFSYEEEAHRAMPDVECSIARMKKIMELFKS